MRLKEAWQAVFEIAQAMQNWERMALAEAKLAECEGHITRIELELQPAPS